MDKYQDYLSAGLLTVEEKDRLQQEEVLSECCGDAVINGRCSYCKERCI